MSRFEKKLCIFAIIFVAIYLGAAVLTIQSRIQNENQATRLESAEPAPGEGQLMVAELFLPMMIFLTVTVCFIFVRKKRAQKILAMQEIDEKVSENPPLDKPDV